VEHRSAIDPYPGFNHHGPHAQSLLFYYVFQYTSSIYDYVYAVGIFLSGFWHEPCSSWYNFRVSRRGIWRWPSCRKQRHVVWYTFTDVSDVLTASVITGISKHHWNVGKHLPDYTVQHHTRQSSSCTSFLLSVLSTCPVHIFSSQEYFMKSLNHCTLRCAGASELLLHSSTHLSTSFSAAHVGNVGCGLLNCDAV
jgi:hypothetical protein